VGWAARSAWRRSGPTAGGCHRPGTSASGRRAPSRTTPPAQVWLVCRSAGGTATARRPAPPGCRGVEDAPALGGPALGGPARVRTGRGQGELMLLEQVDRLPGPRARVRVRGGGGWVSPPGAVTTPEPCGPAWRAPRPRAPVAHRRARPTGGAVKRVKRVERVRPGQRGGPRRGWPVMTRRKNAGTARSTRTTPSWTTWLETSP